MTITAHCFSPYHRLKALAEVECFTLTFIRNMLIPVCVCVCVCVWRENSLSKSKSMGFGGFDASPVVLNVRTRYGSFGWERMIGRSNACGCNCSKTLNSVMDVLKVIQASLIRLSNRSDLPTEHYVFKIHYT
jgi:hypothetical protein